MLRKPMVFWHSAPFGRLNLGKVVLAYSQNATEGGKAGSRNKTLGTGPFFLFPEHVLFYLRTTW